MAQSKSINKDLTKLTVFEQFTILNNQTENLYNLIANTNKFYSVLCSSIVGIAIILYSNNVEPTGYFNYLYYVTILMYAISIIWYRHLAVYLFDLNCKSDVYNQFIEKNAIISMYNSSFFVNARKTSIVIPFFLGLIICGLLLKYFNWRTWKDVLEGLSYPFVFYLGFLHKFDFIKIIKSF